MAYRITNDRVMIIVNERFMEMLKAGNFPSVEFKIDPRGNTSFALMEYHTWCTKLTKLVHEQLVGAGYKDGIYATRLHSDAYLNATKSFARRLMPEDILLVS